MSKVVNFDLSGPVPVKTERDPTSEELSRWAAATVRGDLREAQMQDIETDETAGRTELANAYINTLTMFEDAIADWGNLTVGEKDTLLKRSLQMNVALMKMLRQMIGG